MSEWQKIETAPKDGARIWCGWAGSRYMTYLFWSDSRQAWCAGDGGWGTDRYRGEDAPTHWMPQNPIPTPPETEEMIAAQREEKRAKVALEQEYGPSP